MWNFESMALVNYLRLLGTVIIVALFGIINQVIQYPVLCKHNKKKAQMSANKRK